MTITLLRDVFPSIWVSLDAQTLQNKGKRKMTNRPGHCLQMLCLPGFGPHPNTQNLPHFRAFPASIQEHSPPALNCQIVPVLPSYSGGVWVGAKKFMLTKLMSFFCPSDNAPTRSMPLLPRNPTWDYDPAGLLQSPKPPETRKYEKNAKSPTLGTGGPKNTQKPLKVPQKCEYFWGPIPRVGEFVFCVIFGVLGFRSQT